MVEPVLAEAGFALEATARAEEALQLLSKRTADFCAVVRDVKLEPGLTNWEIARLIRELAADIPIVYATGNVHQFDAHAVPKSVIVAKPYELDEVVSIVLALATERARPTGPDQRG